MYFVVHEYWRDDSLNRINESNTAVGQQAALCVCVLSRCWLNKSKNMFDVTLRLFRDVLYFFFSYSRHLLWCYSDEFSSKHNVMLYAVHTHTHTPNQLKPQILLYYYYKYYMLHVMMLHTHHTHIPITQVNSRTMRNRIREREREHRWIHMRWLIPK